MKFVRPLPPLLLMSAAMAVAAEPALVQTIEKKLDLADGGTLSVANVSGPITLTGTEGRTVSIRAVKRTKDNPADLDKVEVRIESEEKALRIRTIYSNESVWAKLKSLFAGGELVNVQVEYTIAVPRDVTLEVSSVSGSIAVTDTKAPVTLHSVSGDVAVSGATAGGRVTSVSGRTGVRAGSGGAEAAAWEISSTSGAVSLEFGASAFKGATIQTVSGDVTVSLPKGTAAAVDFKSVSGHAEGVQQLADGGPELKVKTVSGGLRVSESGGPGQAR